MSNGTLSRHVPIAVLSAIVAALSLALMLLSDLTPESDFAAYYNAAASVAAGGPYSYHGLQTAYWSPGYPFLLVGVFSLFGTSTAVVAGVNTLLRIASVLLTFGLGLEVLGSRRFAMVSAAIVGFMPDLLYTSTKAAAENLSTPLMVGATWLFVRWLQRSRTRSLTAVALGATLGAAILTRPVVQFVPLAAALAMTIIVGPRRALPSIALLLVACALVVTPWVARNSAVLGAPVVTTNGGANLRMAYNEGYTGLYNPEGLDPQVAIRRPADEVLADTVYRERALRFIAQDPMRAFNVVEHNGRALFSPPLPAPERDSAGQVARLATAQLSVLLRLLLAFASMIALGRSLARGDRAVVAVSALALSWIAIHAISAPGSPRYLASMLPLMTVSSLSLLATAGDSRGLSHEPAPSQEPPHG